MGLFYLMVGGVQFAAGKKVNNAASVGRFRHFDFGPGGVFMASVVCGSLGIL